MSSHFAHFSAVRKTYMNIHYVYETERNVNFPKRKRKYHECDMKMKMEMKKKIEINEHMMSSWKSQMLELL